MKLWKKKQDEQFITLEEVQSLIDEMVEYGFVEISDYTKSGEPRYSVTPLGRMELDLALGNLKK
jgi:hypothetical protein